MFTIRVMVCVEQLIWSLSDQNRRYLFGKQAFDIPEYDSSETRRTIRDLLKQLSRADDGRLVGLIEDFIGNQNYYRPYQDQLIFDTPLADLERFLRLEGWEFSQGSLRRTETATVDLQVEEDALLTLLRASDLPNAALIETHLSRSADDYGRDNNNSMTNSRQALEGLLQDIADVTANQRNEAAPQREQVRDYLEDCGFFTREEKRGFSGVHGFLSDAAHPGIVDQEAARFGRNFALGACHYALQKFQLWSQGRYRRF
jgi:hypothetical protein